MAMMNIETIKEFQYKGYKCLIKKISYTDEGLSVIEQTNGLVGYDLSSRKWWLCGYIVLPKGHMLNGYGYDDISEFIEVHGGFTFAENGEYGTFVIGFDCNHAKDGDAENTEEFVISEIEKAIDQMAGEQEEI